LKEALNKTSYYLQILNNIYKSDLSQDKTINKLKEELNKSKKTISQLNYKIKELENKLQSKDLSYSYQIQSLKNVITQKDEELNKLKEMLQNKNINDNKNKNNSTKIKGGDKCVTFTSNDQIIIYGIPCSGDDIFAEIEEILYKHYPKYHETNNLFLIMEKKLFV